MITTLLLLTLALSGCSSELARLEVTTDAELVDVGDQITVTAAGLSSMGTKVELDDDVVWSVSGGTIVAASGTEAVFTPAQEGSVTITATVGEFSGSLELKIGEKIIAVSALDFVAEGGGEIQVVDGRTYPSFGYWNNEGHYLEWNFEVPKTGDYTLIMMYSTGARFDVYRSISVDGQVVIESVEFPNTGGFGREATEWDTNLIGPIKLEAGTRNIHIENIVPDEETGMNPAWLALVSPVELAETDDIVQRINRMLGL